jgi:hypothetical protein
MSARIMTPRALLATVFALLLSPGLAVPARATARRAQNKSDNDPVRRAKNLGHTSDAQFEQIHKELDAGNFAQALRILHDHRDEVRSIEQALKATGQDAERHPAGFKQLQIHVRKSVRELDQIVVSLPDDQREAFDSVRKDLVNVEKELIDMLFPRAPGKNPEKDKPKG